MNRLNVIKQNIYRAMSLFRTAVTWPGLTMHERLAVIRAIVYQ